MSQNILFFSEQCPHSKKLISRIINTPLYNSFQRVCVDSPQVRSRLPGFVNRVPLIYLAQSSPKYGQVLIDPNIWLWLDEQMSATRASAVSNFSQPQPGIQPQPVHNPAGQQGPPPPEPGNTANAPAPLNAGGDGFMAYNQLEMGGGISSDMYSTFTKVDSPNPAQPELYPHSYETVGNMKAPAPGQPTSNAPPAPGNMVQPTAPGGQNSRSAQRQQKFDQDFNMIKAMRDNEPYARTNQPVMGLPQNFDQQWNNQHQRGGAPSYVQ